MDLAGTAARTAPERQVWRWHSPLVGRTMGVARWGHYGRPLVVFPTGGGDVLDIESFGLVRALGPRIAAGALKVYAVDSVDRQAWTNPSVPPTEKAARQAAYDRWLIEEAVPLIRSDCAGTTQRFAAAGASIGAYNALVAGTKHPDVFELVVGMSGTYAMDRRMAGQWCEDWYYNDPLQFVPNLGPGPQLDALRDSRFVLAVGAGHAENPSYTVRAARALASRDIPHRVDVWWDGDHDWPTWHRMLPAYV